jgi:iron complex outermembrane receptor protein/hemoglobin/transferrin/lactoferrin receptor protein
VGLASFLTEVTVTSQPGMVADVERTPSLVTIHREDDWRTRPRVTIGNALEGSVGVMVQQSTYGQASPFMRGLTGYHVLNLIDGIRFNNSTFRSGPNQYLAFADPSQAERIEAMLGPASSQFGSDALGGAIQLLTPSLRFNDRPGVVARGGVDLFGASADGSAGADANVLLVGRRATWSAGGAWRKLDDLRAGGGRDSHHVLRRFFGLSDDQIGDITGNTQQDTGFSQSGLHTKTAVRLGDTHNLTVWYQRSALDEVRGYKDLWGGLGRLRSDFDPQQLQFFYTRYEKLGLAKLDWVNATFSVNAQSDGSLRQGLRATDRIVRDHTKVDTFGYLLKAATHVTSRQAIVFGGEIYDERVDAVRFETDPRTGAIEQKRALYPDGSRYRTGGVFVQDVVDIIRGGEASALRANIGGRFTRVDARTFSQRNRDGLGRSLGVTDSSRTYQDWTFNTGLTWQATKALTFNFLTGRGFRAPNLNDLGALGLNDLGYEVPADETVAAGGFIGASDGEGVVSNGRRVAGLKAERLFNYEFGGALRWRRLFARAQVFDAELMDPIVRRTLLFPLDRPPSALAGVPVTVIAPTAAQREQSVVSVATALDPRAVKAFVNDGRARYRGLDALFSYRFSTRWSAEGNYSNLSGHDLNPTRLVRRLPPQQGFLALRYQPASFISWIEASAYVSGAQERLSGGDLTDERIGAGRRRSDITDLFRGGLISPWILPGSDGRLGTADDIFAPTSETLAQIRDRVLPVGATINGVTIVDDNTRVPLYTRTEPFASLNIRAGLAPRENLRVTLALMNVLDRNYRIHGSGVDAPGLNFYVAVSVTR